MRAHFEIDKTDSGEFFFRLRANNGEIILASETYKSLSGVKNGIESVKENSQNLDNFHILESENNKHYFTLVAQNGEVIGVSETYQNKGGLNNGLLAVKECSQSEKIEIIYRKK